MIQCLGKQAGRELLPPFIAAAAQGFELNDALLKEYGHGLLAMAAELLEADFAPYLPAAAALAFGLARLRAPPSALRHPGRACARVLVSDH